MAKQESHEILVKRRRDGAIKSVDVQGVDGQQALDDAPGLAAKIHGGDASEWESVGYVTKEYEVDD